MNLNENENNPNKINDIPYINSLSNKVYNELTEYVKYICAIKTYIKKDIIENGKIKYKKGDIKRGTGTLIKFKKS